jgi:hypothetical protein
MRRLFSGLIKSYVALRRTKSHVALQRTFDRDLEFAVIDGNVRPTRWRSWGQPLLRFVCFPRIYPEGAGGGSHGPSQSPQPPAAAAA